METGIVFIEGSDTSIVTIENEPSIIITLQSDPEIVITSLSEQGVPGRDGTNSSGAIEVPFSFNESSPVALILVDSGRLIYRIGLHIRIPFDGTDAAVSVGDVADTDRLMSADQNDVAQLGCNETNPAYTYETDTQLLLSIIPGTGATQGEGLAMIYLEG